MRVWKLCIRDRDGFDRRQGYALAETEDEARELAGNPLGLFVFEKPQTLWPGRPGAELEWSR